MSSLFNQHEADEIVIRNLFKTVNELRGVKMSKVIKSVDGQLYLVHAYDVITEEQATNLAAELQQELDAVNQVLATPVDNSAVDTPAQPEEPTVPATDQPSEPEQPADQAAEAPAPPAPDQAAEAAPADTVPEADVAATPPADVPPAPTLTLQ